MDLLQIHNLRDWKIHLPTLRQWKQEGKIRYIGIKTSHPAVTCVIPATSKVHHMADNMAAGFGRFPDAKMRHRMIRYFESV